MTTKSKSKANRVPEWLMIGGLFVMLLGLYGASPAWFILVVGLGLVLGLVIGACAAVCALVDNDGPLSAFISMNVVSGLLQGVVFLARVMLVGY